MLHIRPQHHKANVHTNEPLSAPPKYSSNSLAFSSGVFSSSGVLPATCKHVFKVRRLQSYEGLIRHPEFRQAK